MLSEKSFEDSVFSINLTLGDHKVIILSCSLPDCLEFFADINVKGLTSRLINVAD